MPALVNKTILIISPQAWGNMFISKHHYAIELARRGNRVYFLNPPGEGGRAAGGAGKAASGEGGKVSPKEGGKVAAGGAGKAASGEGKVAGARVAVAPSEIHPNLWFISHNLRFPYRLKFHALPIFHALMRSQVKRILRAIGRPVDIVWSFDLGWLYPFRFFGKTLKVFHPVDEPLTVAAIRAARGADALFSVTREIVEKYKQFPFPRHVINHGVSEEFLVAPLPAAPATPATPVRIGFSGNLLRPDIDRAIFLTIVRENPDVIFECWGSYKQGQSNIGGAADEATATFAATLLEQPNIILHGAVPSGRLAKEIHRMDGFLICYDIHKDQSGGTNYHKIMEYLSTGKVIVSNNVTAYKGRPDLVQMVAERDHNRQLPALFREVIARLSKYNAPADREVRIGFARENTYERQLERIEAILETVRPAQQTRQHAILPQ